MNRIEVSDASGIPFSEKGQRVEAAPTAECLPVGSDAAAASHFEAVDRDQTPLCHRCASIDLDNSFVDLHTYDKVWESRLMNLGKLTSETKYSPCSLCRLFYAVKIEDYDDPKDGDYFLYSMKSPRPFYYSPGSVLVVISGRIEDEQGWSWVNRMIKEGRHQGFIATSTASERTPHVHSLRARSIDSESVDFDIIRSWIKTCRREHKYECVEVISSTSGLKDLKLIDCEQRRIVAASPSNKYSALSYVWGTESFSNDNRPIHDSLPISLPQTIEDAMKVTKELGLQYIWIDRYCIDQSNNVEKQTQIQQMDLIYQNAFVTIIAAAGTDSHFGLPGVGTSRNTQPTAWIRGMQLVSILSNPQELIKTSKWMQRGWTYQEGYFSVRRLVFTIEQVYYECRAIHECETVESLQHSFEIGLLNDTVYGQHRPWTICAHLKAYCGRELSVEGDAIRAFEGVFHKFRKHALPVHQYMGIPIMPAAVSGRLYRPTPARRSRGEAFAAGLSWTNSAPGTRRTTFPTWSWAGWKVPLDYWSSSCSYGLKIENESRLKVYVENHDGSLSDLDDCNDASLEQGLPGSSGKFIHVEAWTIPITTRYMPEGASDWMDKTEEAGFPPLNFSGYFAQFEDDEQTLQIPLNSLHQKYEKVADMQQDVAESLDQENLLGIVLGRCENYSYLKLGEDIFVLIVKNKGQHFERVGCLEFKHRTLKFVPEADIQDDSVMRRAWQLCFRLKCRRTVRLG